MNELDSIPATLSLQKLVACWIWALECSLPAPVIQHKRAYMFSVVQTVAYFVEGGRPGL